MTHNGQVLPMAGQLKNFCRDQSIVHKQIVEIYDFKQNRERQAGTKAD